MNIDWAFQQEVTFKKLTEHTGFGVPTYGDPVVLKVWWSAKVRLIKSMTGEDQMSEADVKTPLIIDPTENDIFSYLGRDYRVLNAGTPPSIYGETGHRKVYVQSAVK